MRTFLIIIMASLLCASCGVKDDPEYKTQNESNKIIHLV